MRLNSAPKIKRELGKRIAALRLARGWTQEQLAEKLCVSTRYWQAVEGGRENLTIESLVKAGNALRIEVAELFSHFEGRPSPTPRTVARKK